jgi:hypothetical protein
MGDTPGYCPGDCQLFIDVDGDCPGELSSLTDCDAEVCVMDGAVAEGGASMPSGSFLRWPRCFSNISNKLFLVNGLGSTSSIPAVR